MNKGFNLLIQEVGGYYPLLDKICRYIETNKPDDLKNDYCNYSISYKFGIDKFYANGSVITKRSCDYKKKYKKPSNIYFDIISGDYKNTILLIISNYLDDDNFEILCWEDNNCINKFINNMIRQEKIKMLFE